MSALAPKISQPGVSDDFDALLALGVGTLLPAFDRDEVTAQLRATFPTDEAPYWQGDGRFLGVRDGRAWRLEVGLGTVAVRSWDPARSERAISRNRDTDALAPIFAAGGTASWVESHARGWGALTGEAALLGVEDPGSILLRGGPTPRSVVREWSRKSRARMLRAYAELDYRAMSDQPGIAAMVTLTYPGRWSEVAPTASSVKRHRRMLLDRYFRAFGFRPAHLWKLEFQSRGAPHFHLFVNVQPLGPSPFCEDPTHRQTLLCTRRKCSSGCVCSRPTPCRCWSFEDWLSWSWAEVVDHPDPTEFAKHVRAGTGVDFGAASRCTDGRRLAVYFLKHGTKTHDGKEYQNQPPALWGLAVDPDTGEVGDEGGTGRFWGYSGLSRRLAVQDLPMRDFYRLRRVLRRWRAAQGQRVLGLGARGGNSGGWCLVNDGPGFALLLARALSQWD